MCYFVWQKNIVHIEMYIMKIFRMIVCALAMLMPFTAVAREDELAEILEMCLLREKNSPDSIEYNLQLLEKEYEGKTGARRAVYAASLAKLYAMRAYSDVTGEWEKRSLELFREALANPELLYEARTKDFLPIVKRGKDEKVYGRNMLYVVWRAAHGYVPDSVMSEQELIDFYVKHGNKKPAEVKAELAELRAANDSLQRHAPHLSLRMAEVYYPGDSLAFRVDSANVRDMEWRVLDDRGKLVGKNMLVAPTAPGRYTLEVKCKTDARLEKKPKKLLADFVVSRLQYMVMDDMPNRQVRVVVVDARTGKPCPEATVIKDEEKRMVRVALGADSCLPAMKYYERYNYNAPSTKEQPRVAIFTDRAIYRPGQTVQLSAILYGVKHWDARVRSGKECKVELLDDKSRKVLADTTVCADQYGTVCASLEIPKDAELGWYSVRVDGTVHGIRVEEYKRPVFYVEMDEKEGVVNITPQEDAEARDSIITVSGRAMNYDGTPLRGGRVTATSRRINCWWWRRTAPEVRQLDTVYTDTEGRFVLNVPVSRSQAYRYAPMLRVDVSVLSGQGETQTGYAFVRLFTDPPMEELEPKAREWLECPVDTFDATVPARLEFRGKEGEERYVFLTGFAGESVVIDTMMVLADTLHCMEIPYEERFGDGMSLTAMYVKNGEVFLKHLKLRKKLPDTKLYLHWETFRDYTQPGATEQWTLRVSNAKGQAADANVMLGMYDASLDAFGANKWMFSLPMNHSIPYSRARSMNWYSKQWKRCWMGFDLWLHEIPQYDFSRLDNKYFSRTSIMRLFEGCTVLREVAFVKRNTMADVMVAAPESEEALETTDESGFADVELRTDFSETAVFMPQLRTDAEGRVAITFTMPQSLTTWRLNAIAHTKDMHSGTLEGSVVARKALTAKLHLPRFVREKDHLSFTVALGNNSDVERKGKMQVQVLDAKTDKVVMKETIGFELKHDTDTVFAFAYFVAEGMEGLRFRVVATAGEDSDGEQREIPVLSSVVELTDSKALTLEPGESERINVADMFPEGAVNRQLIVEKVADPVQVAVDALPSVAAPRAGDVLSYASAYYAAYKLGLPDTTLYINKVYTMQKEDGSLPWYDGLAGNAYLTREVGYLLARLGSSNANAQKVMAGIKLYLTEYLQESIEKRKEYDKDWTPWISDMRTLYVLTKDGKADKETLKLVKKVLKRLPDDLGEMDSEYIAIAMIVKHALNEAVLKDGVKELKARLTHKDGVYLAYRGGSWPSIDRRLHIHTQVMEAWQTVCPEDSATLRGMQLWLLNQKRTQGWNTPIECIDAVYALTGGEVEKYRDATPVVLRDTVDLKRYRTVTLNNDGSGVMWAAVYAEYALPMDKVGKSSMDISIERTFDRTSAKVGDRVKERVLIDAKRDYEYIVLSVPRAGCSEPTVKVSGCGWDKGLSYYRQVRDDRTDYFIPSLPHGKYVIETELTVERTGKYATGVPTIKCCYAEEFRAHGISEAMEIK